MTSEMDALAALLRVGAMMAGRMAGGMELDRNLRLRTHIDEALLITTDKPASAENRECRT